MKKFGVVAEGPSDIEVISAVLKGALGIDVSDAVRWLVPSLAMDETDLNDRATAFSNWEIVKQECTEQKVIGPWLDDLIEDEEHWVIIHLDSAECEIFGVTRPLRTEASYAQTLRNCVVVAINTWLGREPTRVLHAVAVDEMDAWLLAVHDSKQTDTASLVNVKARWQQYWSKLLDKGLLSSSVRNMTERERARDFAKPLRKRRGIDDARGRNSSLEDFVAQLLTISIP